MNELTPEAQAVLDAALVWASADVGAGRELFDALTAYCESIAPPEPFTRYMWRRNDGAFGRIACRAPDDLDNLGDIWEVLITPVKRVR